MFGHTCDADPSIEDLQSCLMKVQNKLFRATSEASILAIKRNAIKGKIEVASRRCLHDRVALLREKEKEIQKLQEFVNIYIRYNNERIDYLESLYDTESDCEDTEKCDGL